IELRIVGTGPEEVRLARLAGARTHLLGHVDGARLRDLYRGARLFLQPGVEDFGIASVEALACGTPVVAAARGGILDIVEDGLHGVLYPDRRGQEGAAELALAIDKAMDISFNQTDLRRRAESFCAQHFIDRMTDLCSRRVSN
ncbi:MAG: glycosyltransferase, partial [Acidobacteriota bacterium]|nr:glycosyltransferase [Acidobacteriota bacterium]